MPRRKGGKHDDTVRRMVKEGATVPDIVTETGATSAGIYAVLKRLGLRAAPAQRGRRAHGQRDVAATSRASAARRGAAVVSDRRRFKTQVVPIGETRNVLDPASAPARKGYTNFPHRLAHPAPGERVLIDGSNNAKIGGDVLVGDLIGARIYTLTLEERATCPRSCEHWLSCYGNSMQWSRRWQAGRALEDRLRQEVADLCALHAKVLIRLHVLGDFYSVEYVQTWRRLIATHPNLHVFGFTARTGDDPISAELRRLGQNYADRWHMRKSGACGRMGSFTIDFPTAKKMIGDAVVCPEQRDAMEGSPRGKHCGNRAVCWETTKAIVFVEH